MNQELFNLLGKDTTQELLWVIGTKPNQSAKEIAKIVVTDPQSASSKLVKMTRHNLVTRDKSTGVYRYKLCDPFISNLTEVGNLHA